VSLPLSIWIPTGALILAVGAFVALLWLAWDRAPEGQRWSAPWAWAASWAVAAIVVCVFLVVLGAWWELRP